MGLTNLIDDRDDEQDNEQDHQETTGDDLVETDTNYNYDQGINLETDEKCCPQCLEFSQKKRRRTYECPNIDCGVLKFTAGYFERADIQTVFPSIDWNDLVRKWR